MCLAHLVSKCSEGVNLERMITKNNSGREGMLVFWWLCHLFLLVFIFFWLRTCGKSTTLFHHGQLHYKDFLSMIECTLVSSSIHAFGHVLVWWSFFSLSQKNCIVRETIKRSMRREIQEQKEKQMLVFQSYSLDHHWSCGPQLLCHHLQLKLWKIIFSFFWSGQHLKIAWAWPNTHLVRCPSTLMYMFLVFFSLSEQNV